MAQPIRTFIAIELNEATHRALGELQAQLRHERAAHFVRWVAPENIHITLKFLGAVDAATVPALQRAIADTCAGTPPFTLTIEGIGVFPNLRRPNVVWVGAGGQVEIAVQLAQKIEGACAALGFARDDRPFAPHLTLGRVRRDVSPSDRESIGEMVANAKVGALGELRVERVSVMKSELSPGGSVYTRLAAVELQMNK
jgi:2'-5' RNA ligase